MSVRIFDSTWQFVLARVVVGVTLAMLVLAGQSTLIAQEAAGERWIGTWATAAVVRPTPPPTPAPGQTAQPAQTQRRRGQPLPTFNNQTLRQIVRVSLGGDQVRVVLSNVFGTAPLELGAAYIAIRGAGSAIVPASGRAKMLAEYDSGDALHPNDAGYEMMANAIDVALFQSAGKATAAAR
jgi:hypothetical protein